jgi:GTP pyrophosphokinase
MHSSSRRLKNGNALFECTIVIGSKEQLSNLFDKIRNISGVISVDRAKA